MRKTTSGILVNLCLPESCFGLQSQNGDILTVLGRIVRKCSVILGNSDEIQHPVIQ